MVRWRLTLVGSTSFPSLACLASNTPAAGFILDLYTGGERGISRVEGLGEDSL